MTPDQTPTTSGTRPLVIIVPSRGRPHNVAELMAAWAATATGYVAELLIAVDDDDARLDDYLALELPDFARIGVGPRLRLGGTLNDLGPRVAAELLDAGRDPAGVGFFGDDHRPRSPKWDVDLYAALAGTELAVVYGNDLVMGAALPTAVVLDARIVHENGYMVPPGAIHLYFDNYWLTLGNALGSTVYLPATIIEHVHPIAGVAQWDAGYEEVNAPAVYTADEARFRQYLDLEHDDAIAALNALRA